MNKGVKFADDCEFISNHNEEVLEQLLTEMFVEFVNNSCCNDVLEIKL